MDIEETIKPRRRTFIDRVEQVKADLQQAQKNGIQT
jgi:hypothetical protein